LFESDWNCKRIDDERGKGIQFTAPKEFMVYFCLDELKYCQESDSYCMPKRGYAIEIDYCIESRSFRVGFDCDQSRENFIYPPDSMIEIIGSMMASNQIKTYSD
jgi:hypothetical protein